MSADAAAQRVTNGSLGMVWTLVTRAVGLTAGVAVALLLILALSSRP